MLRILSHPNTVFCAGYEGVIHNRGTSEFMFFTIGKPLSLSLLNEIDWNKIKSRPTEKIAVIDDQPFAYSGMLRQLKYNITEVGDISDIKSIKDYGVIICDIKGVGSAFGSKYEGGYVIKEIDSMFPDKYIIAFSGNRFNPTFKRFLDHCDDTLKKDSDIEDWTRVLDYAIEELSHPVKRWLRSRDLLLKNGAELIDVLNLEQSYIESLVNNKPKLIEKEVDKNCSLNNSEPLLEIGLSLATFIAKHLLTSE